MASHTSERSANCRRTYQKMKTTSAREMPICTALRRRGSRSLVGTTAPPTACSQRSVGVFTPQPALAREGALSSVGALRPVALLAFAATAVTLVGCGSEPDVNGRESALDDQAITVASFDFPESKLLAEIYGQALEAGGFDVLLEHGLGLRELVQPALAGGLVEFVPEYSGTALE